MEVIPNLHLVPDVIANPYIIIDADGLTLIDTGLPRSEKKILRYMADLGYTPQKLVRIILTHSDLDHVGALAALTRASGARTYASAVEAAGIAEGVSTRPPGPATLRRRIRMILVRGLFRPQPVKVDELVSEGQTINALGGLRVLETPGHTPGHISLFSPSTGVLFVGDSIVSVASGLVGSVPANTWNQEQAAASVRKQVALRATVICSGHGPVVKDAVGKMPIA